MSAVGGGISRREAEGPLPICTIVSRSYLAHARCLASSYIRHHPGGQVFVLLVDEIEGAFDPDKEPFTTVLVKDLRIPDYENMEFRYGICELCTSVKPFFMEYLLEHVGVSRIAYLDPDIFIYQPLDPIAGALESSTIVLIPHLLDPLTDDLKPTELDILLAGVYNLGFIAVRDAPEVRRLMRWWKDRLRTQCLNEVEKGLFVDQRWADLIPCYFDRVCILRDERCDVAYWNLSHRRVERPGNQWLVNGKPLVFYHFSGFVVDDPKRVSCHCTRHEIVDVPLMRDLFEEYSSQLLENGHEAVRSLEHVRARFDNGVLIPEEARRLWRRLGGEQRWPRPFLTAGDDSYFHWLNSSAFADSPETPLVTNLALEIHRCRADLQRAFPDIRTAERRPFLAWLIADGARQHRLDISFIAPIQATLNVARANPPARPSAIAPLPNPLFKQVRDRFKHWRRQLLRSRCVRRARARLT